MAPLLLSPVRLPPPRATLRAGQLAFYNFIFIPTCHGVLADGQVLI